MTATPNGCRWCGIEQREHMQRWKPPAGWHKWEAPTDVQRLARMRARREARITAALDAERDRRAGWGRGYHADAYASGPDGEDPVCADCRQPDCPRYWRIQARILRSLHAALERRIAAGAAEDPYGLEPPF